MTHGDWFGGCGVLVASAVASALIAPPAAAQSAGVLNLSVGQGDLIQLAQPAATVFVANPAIADVQVAGPGSIFVFGQAAGRTTLFALDAEGRPLAQREIHVEHDLGAVRQVLANRFPDTRVTVTSAPKSVMISGATATAAEADAIAATVAGVVGEGEKVINRMTLSSPMQVNLRVRVSEVSRNVDERLGFNLSALFTPGNFIFGLFTGGGLTAINGAIGAATGSFSAAAAGFNSGDVNVNALIDALDREGLARTLAEPNLTAVSGETASFNAGGEFPVPVAQDNNRTTIEFKSFGVILDFTPTVLSPDRISLRVRPEVSDISNFGAIIVDGLQIPALTVRRVDTTVELASGQSLVIGGLLQQTSREAIDKFPGLGDIPVLGTLFTSSSYQNNETELIVTVTPYVVRPTKPDGEAELLAPRAPGRSLEALLLARAGRGADAPPRLNGPVGFVY